MDVGEFTLRDARPEDYEAVAAFTRDTWSDREGSDYIPDIYHDWIAGDPERKKTVVAATEDDIAGIAQGVLLSDYEAWGQGMRVNPAFRGQGIAEAITHELFDWARERGATVLRNMVFSWNAAGLGNSRYCGYEPVTEFRFAHPEPDADATSALDVTDDVNAAWSFWQGSDTRDLLAGLALDFEESWAVSELTRADLRRAKDETSLLVVQGADGVRGLAYRIREYDRPTEDETDCTTDDAADDATDPSASDPAVDHWVEYGVGAWADLEAARSLFAAVSRDAARRGADRTRVLVPESVRYVSDVALLRVPFADEPDFVLGADLTATASRR